MATLVLSPPLPKARRDSARLQEWAQGAAVTAAFALLAVLIQGYHPFTEDGGLYVAGVERLLNPSLFPSGSAFVTTPTRYSLFAPTVAAVARIIGLPLALLTLHLATIWATLLASWRLAARCWPGRRAQFGAVLLLACWLGLPVAGTALVIMDPYLTARSFSTPAMLLALIGAIDLLSTSSPLPTRAAAPQRQRLRAALLLVTGLSLATAMHPLMAIYALESAAFLLCMLLRGSRSRRTTVASVCIAIFAAAAALQFISPPETAESTRAALTRSYWFLGQWRWFERLGIIAPVAILALYSMLRRTTAATSRLTTGQALASAAALSAAVATLVSLIFCCVGALHLVARLQPMRELQFTYIVLTLCLGAWLGVQTSARTGSRRNRTPKSIAAFAAFVLAAAPLYATARATYSASRHLELPGISSANPWVEAFLWIRDNTPTDALFALAPDYIHQPGEDAHCFRAIAQRSALPDYSKDGGEAAIAPSLASAWSTGQAAQQELAQPGTTNRFVALKELGVTWIVIDAHRAVALDCPYANRAVRVCRLRP